MRSLAAVAVSVLLFAGFIPIYAQTPADEPQIITTLELGASFRSVVESHDRFVISRVVELMPRVPVAMGETAARYELQITIDNNVIEQCLYESSSYVIRDAISLEIKLIDHETETQLATENLGFSGLIPECPGTISCSSGYRCIGYRLGMPDGKQLRDLIRQELEQLSELDSVNLDSALGVPTLAGGPVTFSPDSSVLVVDGMVWDIAGASKIFDIDVPRFVEFSPDGSSFVAAGTDGSASVWEIATGKLLAGFPSGGYAIHIDPRGRFVGVGGKLFDPKTWVAVIETGANAVSFSPDGMEIASFGRGPSVSIWSLETGEQTAQVSLDFDGLEGGLVNNIAKAVFSPNRRYLAVYTYTSTAQLFEVATGENVVEAGNKGVSFKPDGTQLAVWDTEVVRVLDSATMEELAEYPVGNILLVEFAPNWETFVVATGASTTEVWDMAIEHKLFEVNQYRYDYPGYAHIPNIEYSLSGRFVAVLDREGRITVWDLSISKELFVGFASNDADDHWLSFDPEEHFAVTRGTHGVAQVWNLTTGSLAFLLPTLQDEVELGAVQFSPDGQTITAAVGPTKTLFIWDAGFLTTVSIN